MNKHLLELKQIKSERQKAEENLKFNGFPNTDDEIEQHNLEGIDHSAENSVNINISNLKLDVHHEFEEYKKEIDAQMEEKRKKLKEAYTFTKKFDEDAIKDKYEGRFNLLLNEEKQRLEQQNKNKKEEVRKNYEKNLEEKKQKLKEEYDLEQKSQNEHKFKNYENLNKKLKEAEEKISKLKKKLEEASSMPENNKEYDKEVNKLEVDFQNKLKIHQTNLENELNEKQTKIKNSFMNKKSEFQISSRKNISETNEKNPSSDFVLKDNKNLILKNHQEKIKNYRDGLIAQFKQTTEIEKEELLKSFNIVLIDLKNNYDYIKEFYEEQKLFFKTELNIISTTTLLNKIKNIFENKNAIFKNLIDQNYFIIRKKVRELENSKDVSKFTNKELIINKVIELLTMIFYENIYDYLNDDLKNERDIIASCLDDLIVKCEKIISNLEIDKKVQLNMLICNPNFNF